MDVNPTAQPPAAAVAPAGPSGQKRPVDEKERVARKLLESAVDASKHAEQSKRPSPRGERVDIKA